VCVYIYCVCASTLHQLTTVHIDEAMELWCIADKYQLLHLKQLVEEFLEGNLTVIHTCVCV
jgi:hypothetical protein